MIDLLLLYAIHFLKLFWLFEALSLSDLPLPQIAFQFARLFLAGKHRLMHSVFLLLGNAHHEQRLRNEDQAVEAA
jgi:hypothetical protein